MTLMKDISLAKTNAQGEYLYNKVQDIAYDEVFSKYMFYPKVRIFIQFFLIVNFFRFLRQQINNFSDKCASCSSFSQKNEQRNLNEWNN